MAEEFAGKVALVTGEGTGSAPRRPGLPLPPARGSRFSIALRRRPRSGREIARRCGMQTDYAGDVAEQGVFTALRHAAIAEAAAGSLFW